MRVNICTQGASRAKTGLAKSKAGGKSECLSNKLDRSDTRRMLSQHAQLKGSPIMAPSASVTCNVERVMSIRSSCRPYPPLCHLSRIATRSVLRPNHQA
eukprot:498742-Amphidinium_carterae.1